MADKASSQALTLSLTPSNYNGYNIACFGDKSGSIDLTVTGGTAPYTYQWSHGPTTQDVSSLPAGYYAVVVRDAGALNARKEITLTEPDGIRIETAVYEYPNGFNVSCYSCYNGSIQVEPSGGVAPYTYAWSDGNTAQNRTALGPDALELTMTDANGCEQLSGKLILRGPESSDWNRSGNAGTDPNTQFIGTTDNKDVVFRTNGTERLRLKSGGGAQLPSLSFTQGYRIVFADSTGKLRHLSENDLTTNYIDPCEHGSTYPWTWCGNAVPASARLGTLNDLPLRLVTNDAVRMTISPQGKVGIGTVPPTGAIDDYRLFVEDGIVARDVLVKHGPWPDYVFAEGYHLMPLVELRAFLKAHSHLPGLPSAAELDQLGGVELGEHARNLTRTVEEQALYILELERRLERMEQRLIVLETSKY